MNIVNHLQNPLNFRFDRGITIRKNIENVQHIDRRSDKTEINQAKNEENKYFERWKQKSNQKTGKHLNIKLTNLDFVTSIRLRGY